MRLQLQMEGVESGETDRLAPQKVHPGSRPATIILLQRLDPHHLGMLLALYEHQVFVQAVIWGINPFDQWGVELGKKRAKEYAGLMLSGNTDELPGIGRQILAWRDDQ